MGFFGRWVADCLEFAFMLAGAVLFMQIPAVTHAYVVALQQVAQQAQHDIDQRVSAARQYYHLPPDAGDDAVVADLRSVEPSNAEGLQQSISRATMFANTAARIDAASPLNQPITAILDAAHRPDPDKLTVLNTCLDTYVPQLAFNTGGALYGIAGLLIGGLVGHSVSAVPRVVRGPRRAPRGTSYL